jgi:hypothetical protein
MRAVGRATRVFVSYEADERPTEEYSLVGGAAGRRSRPAHGGVKEGIDLTLGFKKLRRSKVIISGIAGLHPKS